MVQLALQIRTQEDQRAPNFITLNVIYETGTKTKIKPMFLRLIYLLANW